MKRNNIIIGAFGVVATAAAFVFAPWESTDSQGSYTQESLSTLENRNANDAKLWLEARYTDPETGLRISDEKLKQISSAIKLMPKNKSVTFIEQGPDNIGGRTRAIQVDKLNNNVIWAGGVSGGLFKSTNQGNQWQQVMSYEALGSPFISSMAQLSNGTLFVATGSNDEAWTGDGVWYTQDQGVTWTKVPGTDALSRVTEIVAPNGGTKVWMTSSTGLRTWSLGDASTTQVNVTGSASTSCLALKCTDDGTVFVVAMSGTKTWVSTDSGTTWTDKSGTVANNLVPQGAPRIEYAISKIKNSSGFYSMYAVRTNNNLLGMNVSHDNGATWSQFVGASGTPSNLDIYRDQGTYNSIVSVVPTDPQKILIGGIDIWKWKQTTSTPVSGGFEKLTQWFLAPTSPKYAHADNHEMQWDGNKLYIGNDGGIGITYDPEGAWYPANRGYNVTQFYGISFDRHGSVIGGAQDNGSLYNDHSLTSWKEFREVTGGDGFQCEISFYNPSIMFTTIQFGSIVRTVNGQSSSVFTPDVPNTYDPAGTGGGSNPFHTRIFLAEYYDINSEDSVKFRPSRDYAAGSLVKIPSLATGDTILYTTPVALHYDDTVLYNSSLSQTETSIVDAITGGIIYIDLYSWSHIGTSGSGLNPPSVNDSLLVNFPSGADTVIVQSVGTFTHYYGLNPATGEQLDLGIDTVAFGVSWDTLTIQDPFQSWFLTYIDENGGELWGTRNALRLSATDPQWGIVARGIGGGSFNSIDVEFSKDLNHCYVSTGSGTIRRIDGLGSVYTSNPNFENMAFITGNAVATSMTNITAGTVVEGLCVNPSNPDDVIAVSITGSIRRSLNATAATPTFTSLSTITSPSPALYDVVVDREDSDIIVVGSSHGVFISEDGGVTWTDASTGFSGTPVYEVKQSWRTWNEGNFRPGEIYIGTFGRGLWSSSAYLGLTDYDNKPAKEEFKTKLKTYPNPTTASTTLSFQLSGKSDVVVNVFNLSGKLVKTIKKSNMSAGSQQLEIDGSDLTNGTYIVKFQAGAQNETVKFIKM